MKNKAKYMALKDLLEGVLKNSLLGGLEVKKEKPSLLKEMTDVEEIPEMDDMEESVSEEKPKALEISITRLADMSKALPKKTKDVDQTSKKKRRGPRR
jgi:hypothetical protein